MNPKIKKIILFVGIALVVIIIAAFFFKKAPATPGLTSSVNNAAPVATPGAATAPNPVGQQFLTTLLSVNNIKLDDSIFSDPTFATLKDSSITLVDDGTEGRPNPFSPIGTDIFPIPPVTNVTTTDTTVSPTTIPPVTTTPPPATSNTAAPADTTVPPPTNPPQDTTTTPAPAPAGTN